MWRLVVSVLAGKSIYRGQKVLFMNTIKAQIKTIYCKDRKTRTAFFGRGTKPVFRSESARYVFFIQMSKEMWDFDADGTGEIMFHKVINGFLPELFGRWQGIGAKHLVSIVLFTRMEYDKPVTSSLELPGQPISGTPMDTGMGKLPHKDFYRVVMSDISSGNWDAILTQLKRDFKAFLRDVSIRTTSSEDGSNVGGEAHGGAHSAMPKNLIAGYPAAATHGNILEAINIASSQFSGDYIDRDLVRTGLSITVVTPGPGVFEVDPDLLHLTTDILVENGVGIELVCLSAVPLHSVPLFKYGCRTFGHLAKDQGPKDIPQITKSLASSLDYPPSLASMSHLSKSNSGDDSSTRVKPRKTHNSIDWHYAIPHWINVSFWTPSNKTSSDRHSPTITNFPPSGHKLFIPRIRIYEIQMMGIMENDMSNIPIPYLNQPSIPLPCQNRGRHSSPAGEALSEANALASVPDQGSLGSNHSYAFNTYFTSALPSYDAKQTNTEKSLAEWMDAYDEMLFRPPPRRERFRHRKRSNMQATRAEGRTVPAGEIMHDVENAQSHASVDVTDQSSIESRTTNSVPATRSRHAKDGPSTGILSGQRPLPKTSKLSRRISFGFRGFSGTAPKATPITEVSAETARFESVLSRGVQPSSSSRTKSSNLASAPTLDTTNMDRSPVQKGEKRHVSQGSDADQASKPIAIAPTTGRAKQSVTSGRDLERLILLQERLPAEYDTASLEPADPSMLPNNATTPWLTVLNPSNPRTSSMDPSSCLGIWHHVFPRALKAAKMKWKSLCSPASLPLTTEEIPRQDQLKTEHEESLYRITSSRDDEMAEDGYISGWLMREMISARFSHGFQIVIGPLVAATFEAPYLQDLDAFLDDGFGERGTMIVMSKGSQVHRLSAIDDGVIEVLRYVRRPSTNTSNLEEHQKTYNPAVRTTLSDAYLDKQIRFSAASETIEWQRLDTFIAGREERLTDSYPDLLRFWRARFVLIPMPQRLDSRKKATTATEDNDEEIRLEGIQRLTQIWQKNRFIPLEERRFQAAGRKRKDTNPLDIIYRTMNPSAIVAAELHESLLLENDISDGKPAQLLPDSDLFERANLNLSALAQTVQGDRGIQMMDRRWHLKLHYNCFIGLELTTWLLNNFRDVDSREEAVELGNELMKSGLFSHVQKRHNFRDGNFFYQISNDYRLPRSESRQSWFVRLSSVPSTPITEHKTGPAGIPSRPHHLEDDASNEGLPGTSRKTKPSVALSKRLVYDVDHRKRSYRQELITLHYDRISSADDCYHLRIDWMNVTPKLIEDAIDGWASLAERYGLRLVELPISEASRVDETHLFRRPYIVKIALAPPEEQPQMDFDPTSLTPKSKVNFPYQRAILKKFQFVLDLEAAENFPASVDVTYSWGKPDYRHPQYISPEGSLLVQITEAGDFLLLANSLCNNQTLASADAGRAPKATATVAESNHGSPGRPHGDQSCPSPRNSPADSPVIRATSDVGLGFSRKDLITPETIKDELEAFCSDPRSLAKFYQYELNRSSQIVSPSELASEAPGAPQAMHQVWDL